MNLPTSYQQLTPPQRRVVREQYRAFQKDRCWHCKSPLTGPPESKIWMQKVHPHLYPEKFFTHPIHLHHNHDTDQTIGAVHAHCNAVLWEHHGE